MKPLLSVLVATVPNRVPEPMSSLFSKLCTQALNQPVEVLLFGDNRRRTLGDKMNGLMTWARGEYLTFVDDDDDVTDDYVGTILRAVIENPADVICFDVDCTLVASDGKVQRAIVKPSIFHPNEEFHEGVVRRKPLQVAVWRSSLARMSRWPSGQYNVDTGWASELWPLIKSEYRIPQVLYKYRWHAEKTEAK